MFRVAIKRHAAAEQKLYSFLISGNSREYLFLEVTVKRFFLIAAAIVLCAPAAAWGLYKPVRVIAPDWVGNITCFTAEICVDDKSKYAEASGLYENALHFVSQATGSFNNRPRITFCSTEECFQSFGFNKASAQTVGRWGIVVSPRAWKDYYVRHEMIHYRQAEELGVIAVLRDPQWFTEGMAYSLSADPRETLSEPWQSYRSKFEAWNKEVGSNHLWSKARNL